MCYLAAAYVGIFAAGRERCISRADSLCYPAFLPALPLHPVHPAPPTPSLPPPPPVYSIITPDYSLTGTGRAADGQVCPGWKTPLWLSYIYTSADGWIVIDIRSWKTTRQAQRRLGCVVSFLLPALSFGAFALFRCLFFCAFSETG